jgi:hypothetical protein
MWKIIVVLLATAAAMFLARLAYDPPPLDKKLGADTPAYAYATGVRA